MVQVYCLGNSSGPMFQDYCHGACVYTQPFACYLIFKISILKLNLKDLLTSERFCVDGCSMAIVMDRRSIAEAETVILALLYFGYQRTNSKAGLVATDSISHLLHIIKYRLHTSNQYLIKLPIVLNRNAPTFYVKAIENITKPVHSGYTSAFT